MSTAKCSVSSRVLTHLRRASPRVHAPRHADRVQAKGAVAAARPRRRLRNPRRRLRAHRPALAQTRAAPRQTPGRPSHLGPVLLRGGGQGQARRVGVRRRRQRSGRGLLRRRGRIEAAAASRHLRHQPSILGEPRQAIVRVPEQSRRTERGKGTTKGGPVARFVVLAPEYVHRKAWFEAPRGTFFMVPSRRYSFVAARGGAGEYGGGVQALAPRALVSRGVRRARSCTSVPGSIPRGSASRRRRGARARTRDF